MIFAITPGISDNIVNPINDFIIEHFEKNSKLKLDFKYMVSSNKDTLTIDSKIRYDEVISIDYDDYYSVEYLKDILVNNNISTTKISKLNDNQYKIYVSVEIDNYKKGDI